MKVGIRNRAWQKAWRYPAYLWSLRWVYAVKKKPGGWYTPYTRVYPLIHHWIQPHIHLYATARKTISHFTLWHHKSLIHCIQYFSIHSIVHTTPLAFHRLSLELLPALAALSRYFGHCVRTANNWPVQVAPELVFQIAGMTLLITKRGFALDPVHNVTINSWHNNNHQHFHLLFIQVFPACHFLKIQELSLDSVKTPNYFPVTFCNQATIKFKGKQHLPTTKSKKQTDTNMTKCVNLLKHIFQLFIQCGVF